MSDADPEQTRPRRARWRRLLRGVGLLFGVLVLIVAGSIAFLHSGPGQRWLTERVRSALAGRIDGTVELSGVEAKLFGKVALRGLVLTDATGRRAVALDELVIRPSWRDLMVGRVVIERVDLHGLRLEIEQFSDGTSSLKRLLKPRPAAPSEPKAKKSRRIVVRAIDVSGVSVTLQKPDRSKLSVRDLGLQASLDAIAADKTVSLEVTRLGAGVERISPDGTRLQVRGLETGLSARLLDGAGTVSLSPLRAELELERPGQRAFSTPIGLGAIEVEIAPGELGAMIRKLELGLVLFESLDVHAGYGDAELRGPQRGTLVGLRIDAKRVNALLGKQLLREDVALRAKLDGPPDALRVDLAIESAGARLALIGTIDVTRLDRPRYDVELVATAIDTRRLLAAATAPDVAVERLVLGLKGQGVKREQIATDIRLDVGRTRIRRIALDGAKLRGRFERGVLVIHELVIDGLDQKLRAEGSYVVADKQLDAKLSLSGDLGRALAALRKAGVPVKSNIPVGSVRFEPGELAVVAKGRVDQAITLRLANAKVRALGGSATIDATLALRKGKLETVDADVKLSRLDLVSLAKLRGRKIRGMTGSVGGRLSVTGTKESPRIDADLRLDARADDSPAAIVVDVRARGGRTSQRLSVVAERVRGTERERLAGLEADVPLRIDGRPRLARGRPLSVKLSVPRRRLKELSQLLPPDLRDRLRRVPQDTELAAEVDIHGTTDAPRGSWRVSATSPLLEGFTEARQAVELSGRIEPDAGKSRASSRLSVWIDSTKKPTVTADVAARFAESPLLPGGLAELDWQLRLDVPKQRIEALPLIDHSGLKGELAAHVELSGNRRDATGRVELGVSDFRRGDLGPLAVAVRADIGDADSTLDVRARAADFEALRVHGKVGVAGKQLIKKLSSKQLGDPTLDLRLDVPRHTFAEWGRLRPKLAELSGAVSGSIHVGGSVREPLAQGGLTADGFSMLGGKPGRAELGLSAGKETIDVAVALGPARAEPPLKLTASASRKDLIALLRSKEGQKSAEVVLQARADAKLGEIVPKLTPRLAALRASGDLDWRMDGRLSLESRDGRRSLADGVVDGTLALTRGQVPIPGTRRVYRDVELSISTNSTALAIDKLSLRESDRENKARRLDARGKIAWKSLRPERVELSIDAADWLLFGGDTLGKPDAPRAALSAKIDVGGEVRGRSREIDVVVRSLDLRMPDRFDKAHWPEQTSSGDVIHLREPGTRVGKLPRPPPSAKPAPPAPGPGHPATTIHISIPKPIHVQKPPFDLVAKGKIDVRMIPGEARPRVNGELSVIDGAMDLGGRDHRISKAKKSRIYFDDAHPGGELDLHLALPPTHPVVLRDISRASAGGDEVRIHLGGPIAKPISTVSGVGNADLWDILPVHNAGRVKYTSQPDMPASSSPQIPREYDVVLLSYMAANLPHNLFLDRINAWSDPYDDRNSYGKIRHLEAERYSDDGKTRVRVNSRPPTLGQSDAELEAGYLLLNRARTKAGVGVVGGSRAGGGPVLFFDWSSED